MRDVDEMTTCQVSFLPIESQNYKEDVTKVLSLIEKSGLDFQTGEMSTTIKGERDRIWALAKEIFEEMDQVCRFVLDMKVSNTCGCS